MTDPRNNAAIAAKAERYLFPSTGPYYEQPVAIESGKGMRVRDADGASYLDFFGGILTVSVGHANERVNQAVRSQMDRLGHVSTMYPNAPIADLAEKLVRLAPGVMEKVFFCTSGTEANDTAVMLAQAHTGQDEIIALRHGYSGRSALGQSLNGSHKYRVVPTMVPGIKHAHAPYCYRCPFGLRFPSCELRCARDIEDLIETTTMGRVAALIAEPILGVGGFITPPPGWLEIAVSIVRSHGGLFICDEVQTGLGRTGRTWGVDEHGVEPDIVTVAKGIANGYPISAVLSTAAIAQSWRAANVATFGGNPIACAAASATIDTVLDENLVENASAMGALLRDGLEALKARHGIIGDVRGRGLMQGVEIVSDEPAGDRTPNVAATLQLFEETKRRGLLVGRGGLHGNVLRVAPPLIVARGEVAEALQILEESLVAVATRRASPAVTCA